MARLERWLKVAALVAVLAMLGIYYSRGLVFQFWADSGGYLQQALGITGAAPYSRPADRNVGYPALVALAMATPWPALVIVLAQAAMVAAALAAVYRVLTRVVMPRLGLEDGVQRLASAALLAGVAAASLYSVVHVQIAALLTEILFTVLVLAAVLAIGWLVLPGRASRRPWAEAVLASAVAALPVLVKPHWQIAALVLALVAGAWLWRRTAGPAHGGAPRPARAWMAAVASGGTAATTGQWLGRALLCFGVPLLAAVLTGLPDRLLAARYGPREHALFGPRTAFCNHAHLVLGTLARRPAMVLQDEAAFETAFRAELGRLVASHHGGWTLLGFNGDLCSYSSEITALLDKRFADPQEQGRFLLRSLGRAALADPLPYAWKVTKQMAAGFLTAFPRFAIHAPPGLETYRQAEALYKLPPTFTAGVTLVAEHGPLPSRDTLRGTWPGRVVHLLLAVVFFGFAAALAVLVPVSVLAPAWRWRLWSPELRESYLVFVALPLVALLSHHLLIALVHSFDIWRYGFNVYFINLLLIGSAGLFWLADWQRWRAARA